VDVHEKIIPRQKKSSLEMPGVLEIENESDKKEAFPEPHLQMMYVYI
jgi:hypothetical protein